MMSATLWDESKNPTGWWMTEKYDGMRLFWDGHSFWTRLGKKVKVPEDLAQQMPKEALDGELWFVFKICGF